MAEKIEDLTISDTISQTDPNIELIPSIYSEIQKIEGTDLGEIENKDSNKTYNASTDSLEAISNKITIIDGNVDNIKDSLRLTAVKVYKSDIKQSTSWRTIHSYSGSGIIKFIQYNNTANQTSGAVATGYAGFRIYVDGSILYSHTDTWGTSNGGIGGILKYNTGYSSDIFTISVSTSDSFLGHELNIPFTSSFSVQSYVYKSNGPLSTALLAVSNVLNLVYLED